VNIRLNWPNQGDLTLTGDNFGNMIQVQPQTSASTPNAFMITGLGTSSPTQLLLGGTPLGTSSYTTPGTAPVYGDVFINLGQGQNTLLFGSSTNPASPYNPVQGNVTITDNANDTNTLGYIQVMQTLTFVNAGSGNTVNNTLANVQVVQAAVINNGSFNSNTISNSTFSAGLTVNGPGNGITPAVANSTLTISGCTIDGNTVINNQNNAVAPTAGNTSTSISGGWLDGNLSILNGDGSNSVAIGSAGVATKIGVVPAYPGATPVTIDNGDGGSYTQFTGNSAASPLTVFAGINVTNGTAPLATNVVTFNYANVAGPVSVNNGGTLGAPNYLSKVTVQNSNLGNAAWDAGDPNPVQVNNGIGYDSFNMTGSTTQWGVSLNNDAVPLTAAAAWGSSTTISGSSIGTGPYGPNNGTTAKTAGSALTLVGDNGNDVVTVSSTTINGDTVMTLDGGNNSVALQQKSQLTSLNVTTGAASGKTSAPSANDTVSIISCNISNNLFVNLGGVTSNTVTISAGGVAGWGQLPSMYLGSVVVTGNWNAYASNFLTIDTAQYKLLSQEFLNDWIFGFQLNLA
jgi:hypothetical protein